MRPVISTASLRRRWRLGVAVVACASVATVVSFGATAQTAPQGLEQQPPQGGGRRGGMQRPQRENARAAATGTATIAGKVVAADTGRPLKRARVIVAGGGRPRAATTDEQGRYRMTSLPAGTYTITATKTGFADGAFGRRRTLRAGTPLELGDGQQLADIDLKLERGGVVTGRVLDEDGEPLARAMVTVLRQQYLRGEKQLAPAGADQSDDRGQFRVFGLPPGDYYVSATAGGVERVLRNLLDPGNGAADAAETTGYAATYYPGVITAADATRVKVTAAQEVTGIDFQLQLVPLATVRGVVVGGAGMVLLLPEGGGGGRGGGRGLGAALLGGQGARAVTKPDGTFSIANVTPGTYTVAARVDGAGAGPRTAVQSLVVTGEEVNVALTPVPGVEVSGVLTLESAGAPPPKSFAGFRVTVAALDSAMAFPRMTRPADAGETGHFSVSDVMAGRYAIRATAPRGWMMKSVYVDGRDVTDQPIEVRTESITGVNVIFTDRISSLSGLVRDDRGNPGAGLTVIAFPADDKLWLPQSRQIVTSRTDASGAYKLTALPAGDYLVVAMDDADVEQGEWFDPAFLEQIKDKATAVKVAEGEQRSQDLKTPAS